MTLIRIFALLLLVPSVQCDDSESPSGLMTGQVVFRASIPIPASKRSGVIAARSKLQELGANVALDGTEIILADITPAGWKVTLGDKTEFIDTEGKFTIEVASGGATEGNILYPNDLDTSSWGSFTVKDLVSEGETPTPIVIEIEFTGPRYMDSCCPLDALREPLASTYPAGGVSCLDNDGPLSTTFLGGNEYVDYVGSTCNQRVLAGCCVGERGSIRHLTTGSYIACYDNHRGRVCQDLQQGDIIVSPEGTVSVALDSSKKIEVHNNGCIGDTHVRKTVDELSGEFKSETFFDGSTLKHYTESFGSATYDGTDRTLTYITPKCPDGLKDTYTFQTDGVTKTITFQATGTLYQFVTGSSTGTIFDADKALGSSITPAASDCDGLHVHGSHPCTGESDPDPGACGHGKVTLLSP